MYKVSKSYPGGKTTIKDISLSFYYGAKIGVLGLNGAGKSTLLKIIAGIDTDFQGQVTLNPGISLGFLEQEPALDPNKTVLQIVKEGMGEVALVVDQYEEVSTLLGSDLDPEEMDKALMRQSELQDKMDALEGWDLESKLDQAMSALNCPPKDQLAGVLSGGEKRRVALTRLLLQNPDVLLLDEPTNHLDAETVFWLERFLHQYPGTVIAVTHDRYFLDNVAGWILELDRGQGIPYQGNYSSWLEQKKKRLMQEEKTESRRQKVLEQELEWIRQSPKARHAKSKARIANYEKMLQSNFEKENSVNEIFIPAGPRLGDVVIEADKVCKKFDHKVLYENLSFKLPPGGIIGVVGPNGTGKTTLFKLITGALKPDSGSFKVGDTVKLAYVDQGREMDPNNTLFQEVADGNEVLNLGGKEINSRAYISRFNFSGDAHGKKVSELSGGERNRVHLAKLLKSGANVLLLDEPTNDLDVNTLRALEDALMNFAGCAVVISHDRYFIDRISTHILAFEGNGEVLWYDGNFSEYMEDKRKRLGDKAEISQKIGHKKLSR